MNTIINPWFIWLIGVCEDIKVICIIIAVLSAIGVVVGIWLYAANQQYGDDDSDAKQGKWLFKALLPLLIITLLFGIALPTKETATYMLIASYTTEDNIEKISETGKDTVDYIFEKIEELVNPDNE